MRVSRARACRILSHAQTASINISLEFCEASAEALPFDDASFDAVTIAFGLRNVRPAVEMCDSLRA